MKQRCKCGYSSMKIIHKDSHGLGEEFFFWCQRCGRIADRLVSSSKNDGRPSIADKIRWLEPTSTKTNPRKMYG